MQWTPIPQKYELGNSTQVCHPGKLRYNCHTFFFFKVLRRKPTCDLNRAGRPFCTHRTPSFHLFSGFWCRFCQKSCDLYPRWKAKQKGQQFLGSSTGTKFFSDSKLELVSPEKEPGNFQFPGNRHPKPIAYTELTRTSSYLGFDRRLYLGLDTFLIFTNVRIQTFAPINIMLK